MTRQTSTAILVFAAALLSFWVVSEMGWIPEGGGVTDHGNLSGLGDDDHPQYLTETEHEALAHDTVGHATSDEVVDDAAPHTVQPPTAATYDPASNRTYFAYLGLERDLYVTYYDHQAATYATPVEVGAYPISDGDNHGAPSLVVDLDGYIHVVWGSHNTTHRHSRSDNPFDISAWTTNTITGEGTYPHLTVDPASGDLYLLDRAGASGHSSPFPSHAYGSLRKSTDGTSWSAAVSIVDTTGAPETSTDFYLRGATFGDDGMLHFAWQVARGTTHDDVRTNIYHAYLDPSDDSLYAADGSSLGSSIDWTDHSDCLAVTRDPIGVNTLTVADGLIAIPYTAETDDLFVAVWDGSSWTDTDLGLTAPSTEEAFPAAWKVPGGWRLALPILNGSFGDVDLYGATNAGTDWVKIGTLLFGASGEGYAKVASVGGGGPIVALTQEEQTSFALTNATVSDLVPLVALSDSGFVHSHVGVYSPVGHTHDDRYYTEAEVDALVGVGGAGELLMQDGVSSPPVPLETEDGTDWLYEG